MFIDLILYLFVAVMLFVVAMVLIDQYHLVKHIIDDINREQK